MEIEKNLQVNQNGNNNQFDPIFGNLD